MVPVNNFKIDKYKSIPKPTTNEKTPIELKKCDGFLLYFVMKKIVIKSINPLSNRLTPYFECPYVCDGSKPPH